MLYLLMTLVPTVVIEYAVLLALGEHRLGVLLSSVAVNILTNVPLNLFVTLYDSRFTTIVAAELLIVVVETLWYYGFVREWHRACVYGLLCNAVSFLTGLFVQLAYIAYINI